MPCDYKNTKPIIAMKDIKKEFSGVWAFYFSKEGGIKVIADIIKVLR